MWMVTLAFPQSVSGAGQRQYVAEAAPLFDDPLMMPC